jgi:radical SAM superfamily enzyme YgiQ (UPF0313 family)
MRTIIVSPPNHFEVSLPAPSLSISVLSDILEKNSMEHCCIDFNFLEEDLNRYHINDIDAEESFIQNCVTIVLEQEPELVAISTWGVALPFTVLFADALKTAKPDLPIILGGLKTEIEAIEVLRYSNSFHTIVIGEGEELLPIIVRDIEVPSVENPLPKEVEKKLIGDTFLYTETSLSPKKWGISNYNNFFFPVGKKFFIEASRSCPFSCIFCSVNKSPCRRKPITGVIEEIRTLTLKRKARFINFADNTVPLSGKWTESLCRGFLESDISLEWVCLSRAEDISPHTLSLMRKAGCSNVFLGIESINPRTLAYINKSRNPQRYIDQLDNNLSTILNSGISIIASTIIGFPIETVEDIRSTTNFVKSIRSKGIRSYTGPLVVYAGSDLWKFYVRGAVSLVKIRDTRIKRNYSGIGSHRFADNPIFVPNNFLPLNNNMSQADLEKELLRSYEELSD